MQVSNPFAVSQLRIFVDAGGTRAACVLREWRSAAVNGPRWLLDGVHRRTRRGYTYVRALLNRRLRNDVTFIGITGSAGKTTAKELSLAILSTAGSCKSTRASENEHFGIAQTVAGVKSKHRYCVVEVSASRPSYLDFSVKLLKPSIAVLTLIAREHFQAYKSTEAIAEEKAKLIEALPLDGTAVLNIDDPLVKAIGERCKCRVIWIGRNDGATIRLHEARSRWPESLSLDIEYEGRRFEVRTGLHGTQLALSVLASLGVGVAAGVPIETAISALADARPQSGRMQVVEGEDGVVFLRDDWKAPYWSLPAPFEFMRDAQAPRKIVIIGTLSDYSNKATRIYPKVAKQALEVADLVIFVGPHALRALKARRSADDQSLLAFTDLRDAASYLRDALRADDLVLLKGSNKADHLVRLILDRTKAIQCWREQCRLSKFCNRCKELYAVHPRSAADRPGGSAGPTRVAIPIGLPVRSRSTEAAVHVVVGLGNPEAGYDHTPHNVGHRALDALADAGCAWEQHPEGLVGNAMLGGKPFKLLKPAAHVNKSGAIVHRFLERVGSAASHCILVHDDVDLALGDVRMKRDGGDAGHKGVRSVITALGTGSIHRIRIGVRRAGDVRQAEQLVLKRFSFEDDALLVPALAKTASMVRDCLRRDDPIVQAIATPQA